MTGPDPKRLAELDALLRRGREALATVREGGESFEEWGSGRPIVWDQAAVNRWKTDCLRFLRERLGEASEPYREFARIVGSAPVLWRAIEPGLAVLERARADLSGS
ncbi:MAG: hypothetical protein L0216_03040 [Planctomycetales bacterium]|nr:hypothetical protein [Planctomycetales bacterium]